MIMNTETVTHGHTTGRRHSATADMTAGITLDNLAIGYRTKDGQRQVATGITAAIDAGKLTCLIGANGVGKSTLLKTIVAFLPKLGGGIYIKSKELSEYSAKELSRLIGVVLTAKPDALNMTAREVVGLGRTPYTGFWGTLSGDDNRVVSESMEQVGVAHLSQRTVSTLSDGERQKVMIAKALAQQTPVIVLDEPTAYLDYPSKVETMLLLMRLSHEAGKTIFMSSHDLELALQTADTLWMMSREEGIVAGSPRELAASGVLSDFVERQGITFDRDTLHVVVNRDFAR